MQHVLPERKYGKFEDFSLHAQDMVKQSNLVIYVYESGESVIMKDEPTAVTKPNESPNGEIRFVSEAIPMKGLTMDVDFMQNRFVEEALPYIPTPRWQDVFRWLLTEYDKAIRGT
jgi:hypothetical protein